MDQTRCQPRRAAFITELCNFGFGSPVAIFQAEESSSSSSTSSSEDVGFMICFQRVHTFIQPKAKEVQVLFSMLNPSNAWQDTDVEEGVAQG